MTRCASVGCVDVAVHAHGAPLWTTGGPLGAPTPTVRFAVTPLWDAVDRARASKPVLTCLDGSLSTVHRPYCFPHQNLLFFRYEEEAGEEVAQP